MSYQLVSVSFFAYFGELISNTAIINIQQSKYYKETKYRPTDNVIAIGIPGYSGLVMVRMCYWKIKNL